HCIVRILSVFQRLGSFQIRLGLHHCFVGVLLDGDIIAVEHVTGFVAGDLHHVLFGYASTRHVARGSAAKIMEHIAAYPGFFLRFLPSVSEVPDGTAIPMEPLWGLRMAGHAPPRDNLCQTSGSVL